ncbi:MAG: hypothetical protein ACRELG_24305, partial [Gemmataceae bacterium]
MAATAGETRKTNAWDEVPSSEGIVLFSTPPPSANDASVAVQTPPQSQEPFTSSRSSPSDTTAKDALFAQLSSRPFTPLSTPPKPLPPPAANMAGSGGHGVGGVSTPKAGGGGGGASGGGGGPGLVNANQFLGDTLGAVGPAFQPDSGTVGQAFQPDSGTVGQAFQPDGRSQAGKPDL